MEHDAAQLDQELQATMVKLKAPTTRRSKFMGADVLRRARVMRATKIEPERPGRGREC